MKFHTLRRGIPPILFLIFLFLLAVFTPSAHAQAPCPTGTQCTAPNTFTVTLPPATQTSSAPAAVGQGSGVATITVTGTNYGAGAAIELCQISPLPVCTTPTALVTTLVSSTTLTGVVPATITAASGQWNVYVSQPVAHAVNLQWTPSVTPLVSYNVRRGSASGGPYALIGSGIQGVAFLDANVKANDRWFYVVTAVDRSNAESGFSNEAAVVIPA
jgi:hypothetical protein